MQAAAADLNFELAADLRDKINALKKTIEKQIIVSDHPDKDQDVFALTRNEQAVALSIINIRKGVINGHKSFYLGSPVGGDPENMAEVIKRYYGDNPEIPADIILSAMPDGSEAICEWLTEQRGHKVHLMVPMRGDRLRLLAMAETNAQRVFEDRQKKSDSWRNLALALEKKLSLNRPPERVICFDISNIGGRQSVGAVVSFFGGEKEAAKYRHYKIKTVEGPDDYASMREVLARHLRRAKEGGFLPDLLLVDGGRGQLSMAISVVDDLGMSDSFETAGIAKEKGSEGEKLYRPGRKNPIILPGHSPILLFLMRIRDESHRFGITFHRKWRQKETLTSELAAIPGLGPVKMAALLKEIGSVSRIKEAGVSELTKVKGINQELAKLIIAQLSKT